MDKIKQYAVLTLVGVLAVLALGWFLLVSPKHSEAADLTAQADAQLQANAAIENQLRLLKAQAEDLPQQQAKLAAVAAKIPDNPALPNLVRALVAAGKSAGVELVSVVPGSPSAVTAAQTPGAAPVAPGTARTTATASAGQLTAIPLTLTVAGGYFQVEQFVANLENLPRALRVTNLAMTTGANPVNPAATGVTAAPVDDGRALITTVTGQVFMAASAVQAPALVVPGAVAPPVAAPRAAAPSTAPAN
jgi:Tfp pilus assembly protein PilO